MSGPAVTLAEVQRARRGRKAIKYALVSVVSVGVAQVALFILFGLLNWTAKSANIAAAVAGGIPSYYLNRSWVWGRSGRSHLWKEVLPFWVVALLGLAFSTWAADFAATQSRRVTDVRELQALFVNAGSLTAYGVLWVAKFVLFNRVIFVDRSLRRDVP